MLLEVRLISIQHPIVPRQQLLSTVIRVQDYRDPISRSDGPDERRSGDGTSDGTFLSGGVLDSLAGEVGGSSLGDLEDDWGVDVTGGFEGGVDGGGGGDVL